MLDLDRANKAFEGHGGKAIVLGHLIPGVGALISLPTGIKRMPLIREFMGYTIIGSALLNVVFIGLGWALGANRALVERYATIIQVRRAGRRDLGNRLVSVAPVERAPVSGASSEPVVKKFPGYGRGYPRHPG